MTVLNPEHLLQQAARLIESPQPGPARQVDIRRAISACYYSVFHRVLCAAADTAIGRVHRATARYARVYRSVEHRDLRTICDIAKRSSLPVGYQEHGPVGGFVANIRAFAESVVWLQERRHAADDDPRPRYHAGHAREAIIVAAAAHQDWRAAPTEQKDALLWLLLFRPRP